MNTHFVILISLGVVMFAVVWTTLKTGSSPVPTSRPVLRVMLDLLPKRLPDLPHGRGSIVDLGSGWGGVGFVMAKRYPNHPVIGFEVSFLPWVISRLRLMFFSQDNLTFQRTDFMQANLASAALAICYLAPESMTAIGDKLNRQMAVGALVLANTFSIREWRELDRKTAADMYRSPVYLYEIGST